MRAWGYKALESDEGLEVIDFLEKKIFRYKRIQFF